MDRSSVMRAAGVALVLLVALLFYKVAIQRPTPGVSPAGGTAPVQSSSLTRTDASGSTWAVERSGGGLLVSEEPNAPQAGPPILVKTSVQRQAERQMSIGLVLEGQAGEHYRPVVKKDGKTLAAPTLRIVNEAGQVLVQDSFQYG
ncbi:MAG: hypothetical protein FJ280_15385 [Planctomycetes bacterium]|nr:hypothetical protein [Planctomycetota bacterium]